MVTIIRHRPVKTVAVEESLLPLAAAIDTVVIFATVVTNAIAISFTV